MLKFLQTAVLCATMLVGGDMQQNSVQQYLISPAKAQVIIGGEIKPIDDVKQLTQIFSNILTNSHTMPAFGVSIHIETIKAVRQGVWLKLQYNGTQTVDEMSFDELLIEVNSDFSGFNVIRGNRGIYEGRCYYVDLIDNTMANLYNYIIK